MNRFVRGLVKASPLSFAAGLLLGIAGTAIGAGTLGSSLFIDVPRGAYYDGAIGRLADRGIVKGMPDGTFHPADFVTRADVAVMLDRALNGTDADNTSASSSGVRSSRSSSSSSAATATAAGSIQFSTPGFNVGKGATSASLTVMRTGGSKGTVKVDYSFGGGTAIAGTDYVTSAGTLTYADGENSKTISVNLTRSADAPTRTLNVTLSSPTNGAVLGSQSTTVLTLLGVVSSAASSTSYSSMAGAGVFGFSAYTYSVDENKGTVSIAVNRTSGTTGAVTVNYATSNGSAQSGTNYTTTTGTLNFAAGESSKSFTVPIIDNSSIDGNRTVNLTLSSPTGGAGIDVPANAMLTIVDEESGASSASGSLQFSESTYTVSRTAAYAEIKVLRQLGNTGTVTVNYAAYDGTGIAGSDYTPTSGTLTFAPGESSKSFRIPLLSSAKSGRVINLSLATPSGAVLGERSIATVTLN